MSAIVAFAAGVVFALGLAIGGMTDPLRVLAFLDVTGDWDPRLAFVMGGALGVYALASRAALRRARPVLASRWSLPTRRDIDARLLLGAAASGWGMAGYCPGPAITSLGGGSTAAAVFVAAMLLGMWLEGRLLEPRRPG